MFLRKPFLVFPCLVGAMTDDSSDSLSANMGFLGLENPPPHVKTEDTSPSNPPEMPSEENEKRSPNNTSASSSNIQVCSGVGDDANVAANDAPESAPETVENTQPQTVRVVEAIEMNGVSRGNFKVSSIRELREKVAAAKGVRPEYRDLLSGDVILKDNGFLPEIVEWVQVIELSPEARLSQIVEEVKALDWKHVRDPRSVKAKYWTLMMEEFTLLFDQSDDFSSDKDEEKCGRVVDARGRVRPLGPLYDMGPEDRLAADVITTSRTPDCLKSRLRILEAIWNAQRELSMFWEVITNHARSNLDPSPESFQDLVGDLSSADLSEVSMRTTLVKTRFDITSYRIVQVEKGHHILFKIKITSHGKFFGLVPRLWIPAF